MELSIIVPTYNVEKYLANCLDSLINQDLSPESYEIIVVNDGSTDASPEIAMVYEENHAQVRVFHQENQGLSAARNKGMKLAQGKVIYFVDSDDYIAQNTLSYALNLMKRNDLQILGLEIMRTEELDIYKASNYEVIGKEEIKVTDGITYLAENPYLNNVWWYLVRRDYLLNTGLTFPVGRYFEDCIFTATLLTQSSRIAKSSLDFYRYVIRPDSIMTKRTKEHALKQIADHEKNIYEFKPLLDRVEKLSHKHSEACLDRLKAMQHSFVFFMLLLCYRCQLSREYVSPIIERLSSFGAYPINRQFINEFNNLAYSQMRFIMNRKFLLYKTLKYLVVLHRSTPNVHWKADNFVKVLAQFKIK
ncbi:MAG: glycosyltransferase [Robiginitalea sp.]|uniref:glycosyltransferase n=1 Tax=Robiginitalea sp. TaxID=1902411 RepID=UPI003C74B953